MTVLHIASEIWAGIFLAVVLFIATVGVAGWVSDMRRLRDVRQVRHLGRQHTTDLGPCADPVTHAAAGCLRCVTAIEIVKSIADDEAWDRAFEELGGTA